MKSSPSPVAVFAGLAIAAGLVYLVAVHWWFTAPMLRMGDEITALRMEELTLRMEIAQKPQLEAELARVRAVEAGNPGFLQETAALVQRLEAVVQGASPNPAACQITARTPSEATTDEPFVRATVRVGMRCAMPELGAVLHALENGSPQLFVDNLDILSRRTYLGTGQEGGLLDVGFDLYGYLKTAAEVPAGG